MRLLLLCPNLVFLFVLFFLCVFVLISILIRILVVLVEKAMAPHSSTLAWKIPWLEEPGRLQSMGS